MQLYPQLISEWPKLAWVCMCPKGADKLVLYHGPLMEIASDWCAEAVWTGDFSQGGFDQTDLVFGSGVRCYKDRVFFVSSGTMLDSLWWCDREGKYYLSNSLPALMAVSAISLQEHYFGYVDDIHTLTAGLNRYKRIFPAEPVPVNLARYHNLLYDGRNITHVEKPHIPRDFSCYQDYYKFLTKTAHALRDNRNDLNRKHKVHALVGISRGYDSGAAAVIAREAGCQEAATIVNASSLLPRTDSGVEIAEILGLHCEKYVHKQNLYRDEISIWSAAGQPAGLNLTIFNYPEPLAVFFSGYCGDTTWCRQLRDRSEPFSAPSIAGLSFCEYRLWRGLIHCVVPSWGSRNVEQIQAITFSPEMEPWTLHNDYDRPIPRRILEEAGVPRNFFGMRKEATIVDRSFLWPFLPESRACFASYLQDRNLYSPFASTIWLLRKLAHLDQLVTVNFNHILKKRRKGFRHLFQIKGQSYLFHWANTELKKRYQEAFNKTLSSLPQETRDD